MGEFGSATGDKGQQNICNDLHMRSIAKLQLTCFTLGTTAANNTVYLALAVIFDSASFIASFLSPPDSASTKSRQ